MPDIAVVHNRFRAEAVLLAFAIIAGSGVIGGQLAVLAARPTEFAACAALSAEYMQRREGSLRPTSREQLVASMETAKSRGEADDAARIAALLQRRDELALDFCAPSS